MLTPPLPGVPLHVRPQELPPCQDRQTAVSVNEKGTRTDPDVVMTGEAAERVEKGRCFRQQASR